MAQTKNDIWRIAMLPNFITMKDCTLNEYGFVDKCTYRDVDEIIKLLSCKNENVVDLITAFSNSAKTVGNRT